MLIVQICDFGSDGDAEYRMHAPVRELGQRAGVTTVDCHFAHRSLPTLVETADVVIVQFINDWELLAVCQRRRRAGLVTVFEASDNFFDIQPWSPIAEAWLDRTLQELFLKWLTLADGVQTSTAELARQWRNRGANEVAVFPNQLVRIDPLPEVTERPLTIGWGGSPGHFADWFHLAPYLTQWLRMHPDVHLAVMAHELAHSFIAIEPHRYHVTKFGSLSDDVNFLRSLDIGLAPLLPTDYNRGRSDVKFLEYASQGVAGIYTDLEPYRSSVVHGVTGLLSRSPSEMMEHLERLRTDLVLRQQLRNNAFEYVQSHRRLSSHVDHRLDWYRSLLHRNPERDERASRHIEAAATSRDGNYFQLRPQDPERILLNSMQSTEKRNAVEDLHQLLQREPAFGAALARQGQLLNDVRDHPLALKHLDRALALSPQNPRVLSEIGRTWFLLDHPDQAIRCLEQSILAEPDYLPAWQYLLRLLTLQKSSDGPIWAVRAEERFPDCYPVAFLGAQVYSGTEAIHVLTRIVDRLATTLLPRERLVALRAVRQAFSTALQSVPDRASCVPLLQRAYGIFPESAWLANQLGSAQLQAGQTEDAYESLAEALRLSQQASLFREEFPDKAVPLWPWQWAAHIQHGTSTSECAEPH